MPLEGWDHVELWVGNAKQAAYFYEHAFGFTRAAYAGPGDGRARPRLVRARAGRHPASSSRAALREDSEIASHRARHGDGVKDIALTVPDATEAYRQAVQRGARGVVEPHCGRGRVRPRRAVRDRDLRRDDPHVRQPRDYAGPYLPGYVSRRAERRAQRGVGLHERSTTSSATSSSAG